VGGHTVFGELVHLVRADLHFERAPVVADHDRMQRLVAVRLRPGDVVVELSRHRLPQVVHDAEHGVAILDVGNDDAKRAHVVEFGEIELLAAHLAPDAVDVLRPPRHLRIDVRGGKLGAQAVDGLRDVALALHAFLVEQLRDALVGLGLFEAEREVLELPLQLPDAEPVRKRRVDFERLARHVGRRRELRRGVVAQRLQPRGEPDQHDTDVLREREQHLAQRFDLRATRGLRVATGLGHRILSGAHADGAEPQQLAHVRNELRNLFAEAFGQNALGVRQIRREREERRRQHRGRIDVELAHDRCRPRRMLDQ
jgi:hypothetical protein